MGLAGLLGLEAEPCVGTCGQRATLWEPERTGCPPFNRAGSKGGIMFPLLPKALLLVPLGFEAAKPSVCSSFQLHSFSFCLAEPIEGCDWVRHFPVGAA